MLRLRLLIIFCCMQTIVRTHDNYSTLPSDGTSGSGPDENGVFHFKLGFIAPWNGTFGDFSALTSASAVSLAMERVHNDPTLGKRIRFSVVTKDSACMSKVASGNAVKLFIEDEIDAFIGPPCSVACRPVAELASYWNKPVISWVATDPDFNDKSIYTTLGRTIGPFNKMGSFLVEVFNQYNWRRVVIISSNYFLWLDAGKALRTVFRESNITIAYSSDFERNPSDAYMIRTLKKTQEEGRIILLIAPKEDRRRFMLRAHDLGMTKGEYVFYTIEMLPEENVLNPEDVWSGGDGRDVEAKQAFEAVFHVTLAALTNREVNVFRKEVARRMRLPPWDAYLPKSMDTTFGNTELSSGSGESNNYQNGDKYSPFLHDAVLLYAIAINETITKGGDVRSGVSIANYMRGKTFIGITGMVVLDDNGDREPDYWITDMAPNGTFIKVAEVLNTDGGRREFRRSVNPPRWPGGLVGHEFAPPDVPACGFRNEFCKETGVATWIIALAVVLALLAVGAGIGLGVYLFRKGKFETQLLLQAWKVQYEDLEPLRGGGSKKGGSTPTLLSQGAGSVASKEVAARAATFNVDPSKSSQSRSMPSVGTTGTGGGQIFSDIAIYKGVVVAMKHIKKEHIQVTRQVMLEFNAMKDIIHENLNVFVGACVDPPNICIIWHYCSKGSLLDVLENDGYKLDMTFKYSFMTDLSKGMQYLHFTNIGSHGNLKDSNCVIDARWRLKVTDYGLPSVVAGQDTQELDQGDQYKRKLWTSPEILRENFPNPRGSQKGDVYSFAIISFEILMRSEPYSFETITPRDVINRVRNGESIPYRPALPESSELGKPVLDLIRHCWDENTDNRPSFAQIRSTLRKITKGEINIMDNVLKMMEKYAYNLEEIVEERTQQLVEEKKKTDRLLYRMLPSSVAEQLKAGKFVQPENYDQATVYFSDIVGFAQIAADSSPMQIVDFLNDLYTCFDDIIGKHDVYKVETIGDAYMLVSGVPIRNGKRHSPEIANVSLDLLSEVTHFRIKHRPHEQLNLRIGMHSGPVVAGVVGLIMPRYCLFGDTVNMAARMESSGKPLRIHVSKTTYIALTESGVDYEMSLRGEMNVKGKGLQTTYWLHGKKGFDKSLPAFDKAEMTRQEKEEVDKGTSNPEPRHALMQSYDSFPSGHNSGMPAVV